MPGIDSGDVAVAPTAWLRWDTQECTAGSSRCNSFPRGAKAASRLVPGVRGGPAGSRMSLVRRPCHRANNALACNRGLDHALTRPDLPERILSRSRLRGCCNQLARSPERVERKCSTGGAPWLTGAGGRIGWRRASAWPMLTTRREVAGEAISCAGARSGPGARRFAQRWDRRPLSLLT